jgi:RNA polymerase sigma-70 factor (ECF subfamily)
MMTRADADSHAALIVAIARESDSAAFTTLFAHFAPRLKTYLQRTGLESSIAEEMAQEALLTVWRKAAQYDPARATAGAWIFSIASHLRIDTLRRNRLALPTPDPSEDPMPMPLSDAILAADESAQQMRRAIDMLPPEQLTLLQLAFFEDLSHSEIQTMLGVPLGTIKSRLRLALARLRAALKDCA